MEFISKKLIEKGWSRDKKYHVTTSQGVEYLLRVSDIAQFEAKQQEFFMMKKVAALNVPMCQPVDFGISEEGVYSVQTWIEGRDLIEIVAQFSNEDQYKFGFESGQILKKIHSIPAPSNQENWADRFNRKIDGKIFNYSKCPLKHPKGQRFIDYINNNRYLLNGRPQSFQHGDYHIGNMMVDKDGKLQIIDFNRMDFGDPWEEFNRIVWCAQKSHDFATGMVNGYFDNNVPSDFWKLLALYISSNTLSSIYWAIPFGKEEIDVMIKQTDDVLSWYNDMKRCVPSWYIKEYLQ